MSELRSLRNFHNKKIANSFVAKRPLYRFRLEFIDLFVIQKRRKIYIKRQLNAHSSGISASLAAQPFSANSWMKERRKKHSHFFSFTFPSSFFVYFMFVYSSKRIKKWWDIHLIICQWKAFCNERICLIFSSLFCHFLCAFFIIWWTSETERCREKRRKFKHVFIIIILRSCLSVASSNFEIAIWKTNLVISIVIYAF